MTFLLWATLILAAVYVLVLLYTLLSVVANLWASARLASRLASGLATVATTTEPVGERLRTINGALVQLRDRLTLLDERLAGLAQRVGLE